MLLLHVYNDTKISCFYCFFFRKDFVIIGFLHATTTSAGAF